MAWSNLKKGSKYHAQKTVVGGITFDSKREAARWQELKLMEKAGAIQNLQRQVKYELIPILKKTGERTERSVNYIADFVYTENGKTVVEDSKGFKTEAYKIKRKLMILRYGIWIKETS